MEPVEGARTFLASSQAYDEFMGRYSNPLAREFAGCAGITPGQRALDVGCGPGALTAELVRRLGAGSVAACDPSPPFLADCRLRFPDADVRAGRAEALPFADASYDAALAQLVLHFTSDPEAAVREMCRVVVPGGLVAACVWDFEQGMEMLRAFWDAAVAVDPSAPDELHALRFGRAGQLAALFEHAGLLGVTEQTLTVRSSYTSFDELWSGFLHGIGPAGSYAVGLPEEHRAAVRERLFTRLGSPTEPFILEAVARAACGRLPA